MCVLAFAWRAHPDWLLILAGNRDELHDRAASPLARWPDRPSIIAGRDLVAGGTWLGISETGRLAVVTNLRGFGGPDPNMLSRGALVTDYLGREVDAAIDTTELASYNPFNLIVADSAAAHFLTNRPQVDHSTLAPGIYGLSNGMLDEPWPKTLQIKAGMLDWIVNNAKQPDALLQLLHQDQLPSFGSRPHASSDIAYEAQQSPIFIRHPVYGTRCSTVVAVTTTGAGSIVERRFGANGSLTGETRMDFSWPIS